MKGCSCITVVILLIYFMHGCGNSLQDPRNIHDIAIKNFGCSNIGEFEIHHENSPNCPCGKYAENISKPKKASKRLKDDLSYWDEKRRRWHYYTCVQCKICSSTVVISECSIYNDTVCGIVCTNPDDENTEAGCYNKNQIDPRDGPVHDEFTISPNEITTESTPKVIKPEAESDTDLRCWIDDQHFKLCLSNIGIVYGVASLIMILALMTAVLVIIGMKCCRHRSPEKQGIPAKNIEENNILINEGEEALNGEPDIDHNADRN